ncbi:hypothetical protein R1sor_020804 [Riccia sorocarpa]|uniref:Embryonic stem cell-specific 5-hydroxymethylcytosine-binding protein n=1 Tax=Riccia sorocarpa TaxID=122646 RepID=A0ABD3GF87_9MARC
MCGRARSTLAAETVGRAAGFRNPLRTVDADRYRPSYNAAPGRYMPVVRYTQGGGVTGQDGRQQAAGAATEEEPRQHAGTAAVEVSGQQASGEVSTEAVASRQQASGEVSKEPVVQFMKWGLVPSYTKKNETPDHYMMFNARSESVHIKPTFKRLLKGHRCVVPVEGFYEWKKDGNKRHPYYVHFKDGRPLLFAGLYDSWKNEEGNVLHTFTILTTRNSKALGWLHDRMPVILGDEAAVRSWLDDELTEAKIHALTLPYEAPDLVWHAVTPEMGKPSFDSPECVQEFKPPPAKESAIFQLFGKKKAKENLSQESQEKNQQTETAEDHPSGKCSVAQDVVEDVDIETEEDRKALLAGMEPDQDVTEGLHKQESLEDNSSQYSSSACVSSVTGADRENEPPVRQKHLEEDFVVKEEASQIDSTVTEERHGEKFPGNGRTDDFAVKREAEEEGEEKIRPAPLEEESVKHEPEAKKRQKPISPKGATKIPRRGAEKTSLPDKQKSLHSFFVKK